MGYGSPIDLGTERYDTPNKTWLLHEGGAYRKPVIIEENSVDSGNTGERTTKLRSGLVLGKITATGSDEGKYAPCNEGSSDGREDAVGILLGKVDMLDEDGQAGDRMATMLWGPALVNASKCYVTTGGSQVTLANASTSLAALRTLKMSFKGDA